MASVRSEEKNSTSVINGDGVERKVQYLKGHRDDHGMTRTACTDLSIKVYCPLKAPFFFLFACVCVCVLVCVCVCRCVGVCVSVCETGRLLESMCCGPERSFPVP